MSIVQQQKPQDIIVGFDASGIEKIANGLERSRWVGMRSERGNVGQLRKIVQQLKGLHGVTGSPVPTLVTAWRAEGLSASTINQRLFMVGMLGLPIKGYRVRLSTKLKWWLRPDQEALLVEWLGTSEAAEKLEHPQTMANFVMWTTRTGMRVEETLRLRRDSVVLGELPTVDVPGTKTNGSQACLPITAEAMDIWGVQCRLVASTYPFAVSYVELWRDWQPCREFLGVQDVEGSTMKAFRRSAARYLHVRKGMPLDILRDYFRHNNVKTTMGYLRLTGGYGTEEIRRYL